MTVITRARVVAVARRAYGPDIAASLAGRLPERLDLDDPADRRRLFDLGLTPDRMADALGGEI